MINLFTMGVQQMVFMAEQIQKWEVEMLRMQLRNFSLISEQAQALSEKGGEKFIRGAEETGNLMRSSARSLRSAAERQTVLHSKPRSNPTKSKGNPRRKG